jgi:hypothetical protein
MRLFRLGTLWFILFLLAAFVLFVEFVAEVPGNAEPVSQQNTPAQLPTPSPVSADYHGQSMDSSSNTKSPLS